jgi:hypothetical protein
MNRLRLTAVVLAALAALAVPQNADAQLGGLIKKKVKEAIKPPEKKDPAPAPSTDAAAPAAAAAAQPVSDSRDPFAGQRVPNARALIITDEMISRIYRGLDAEAVMLKDLEKEIAAYPTPQAIQACKAKASQTPEGQRLMNLGNFVKEGMTPDQVMAGMTKMSQESDAYYKKACPWDESKWSDYNRSEARKAIRTRAAAQATAVPAATPAKAAPVKTGTSHLLFETNPFDLMIAADTDTSVIVKGLAGIGLNELDFGEMIERILKYCELRKTMDVKPRAGGLKVHGDGGPDINWIYTESELKVLEKFDCEGFKRKYANQLGAYA